MSHQILPNLISQIFQLIPPLHPFVSILALITYHPPPLHCSSPGLHPSHPQRISLAPAVSDWIMSLSYPNPVGDFRLSTGKGPNFPAHSWPQQLCQPLIFTAATGHASLPSSGHLHMQDPAQGMPSVFPLLLKLLILSGLRATILCLPSQASQFLYFRPLYRLSLF